MGAALDVEADGVHDCPRAADGGRDRRIVIYVGSDRLDAGASPENSERLRSRMPRGDPNGKIGITQMDDDAAAEKTRAAKDCNQLP